MKILFTIGNFGIGGKERQLVELIKNLDKSRFEVHLIAKQIDKNISAQLKNHTSSTFLIGMSIKNYFLKLFNIVKYINSVKPQIIFTWSDLTSKIIFALIKFRLIDSSIVNCSTRSAPQKISLKVAIERLLNRLYPVIVSNSMAGLEVYNSKARNATFILRNGFDINRIGHIKNLSKKEAKLICKMGENKFCVLMVGRLCPQKDYPRYILTAKEYFKRNAEAIFYIAGEGKQRKYLEKLVRKHLLQDRVVFLGYVKDVETLIKGSDLLVLLSNKSIGEGSSNVLMESLAIGTPVLADDNPGNRELLGKDLFSLIMTDKHPSMIANKISEVRKNPIVFEKYAKIGSSRMINHYSMTKMLNDFQRIVEYITKSN
ncbi:MAG: hypothetical protein ACD_22C00136G0005 [uncultured bacterium]|nr:MAG: hypothetical protein ACD_22C00136G0005 [uncultured bacterium]